MFQMRNTVPNSVARPTLRARYLRTFSRDEDGSIILLTLLLLIVMLVIGGMAVDFMRYESRRATLQSVADRAVLAAANLNQDLDAEEVVRDYFDKAGYGVQIIGRPRVPLPWGWVRTVKSKCDCASFPGHYFETNGDALVEIFESIARQIKALRLTL